MKGVFLLSTLVIVALSLTSGCSGSGSSIEGDGITSTESDSTQAALRTGPGVKNIAYVYVDGKEKAVTPAIVRVRRSFGARTASLRVGVKRQVVREFEFEWNSSSSQSELAYSFRGTVEGGVLSYTVPELPVIKKTGVHVVPYSPYPIKIEDHEYELTLIVEE